MAKSPSSAGDLAEAIFEDLQRRGNTVSWVDGEDDTIGVEDDYGNQMFVKVELA